MALVTLQPDSSVLGVASQLPLVATLRDANEKVLSGRQIFWASQDTTIAVVSQSGVVTARHIGITQIAASCEGQNAIAVIIVARDAVARVVVLPSPAQAIVGDTVHFAAQTLDGSGGNLTGRPVLWASSNQGIATIDAASGRAITHATGTTTISATSEGTRGTALLTVSQAPVAPVATVEVVPAHDTIFVGDTRQLTATLRDARGNPLTGRAVVWTSGDNKVATVSAGGLVTAVGRGTATVTAASEGKSGAATIVALAVAVAHSVEIMPHDPKIQVAETVQLQATVLDQDHHPIPGAPVVWSVDNSAIATVSAIGLVRGVKKGNAMVRATSGGVAGQVHVHVH